MKSLSFVGCFRQRTISLFNLFWSKCFFWEYLKCAIVYNFDSDEPEYTLSIPAHSNNVSSLNDYSSWLSYSRKMVLAACYTSYMSFSRLIVSIFFLDFCLDMVCTSSSSLELEVISIYFIIFVFSSGVMRSHFLK